MRITLGIWIDFRERRETKREEALDFSNKK